MPWFGTQGLLLSGQFLHTFLSNASPTQLGQFLPGSAPTEVQLLRALIALVPATGALAAAAALAGGLVTRARGIANAVAILAGLIPLVGWAIGTTRLPAGASAEIGLWLVALGACAVLGGVLLELIGMRSLAD